MEGGLIKADKDRIGGLLDLAELEVSDVMVHRTKLFALNADLPPEELVEEVLASPFTRIPLWRDDPDNMVGLLHAKDVLRAIATIKGDLEQFELAKVMSRSGSSRTPPASRTSSTPSSSAKPTLHSWLTSTAK